MAATVHTCLVTGGSSGVGLATAMRFAAEGYQVAICGRDPQRLETAKKTIHDRHPSMPISTASVDLGAAGAAARWVADTAAELGGVDVLVNSAGLAPLSKLPDFPARQFDEALDINVKAVFATCRAAWPFLAASPSGTILNISSLAAVDPFAGFSVYGACKAWVELFTKAIATEGKPDGVSAYAIRLGAVETPMLRSLFPDFPADQTLAPEDVAELLFQLTQPGFRYASGDAIQFCK